MSCIVILSVSVLLHQICLAEGPLCYVAFIVALIVVLFCVSRVWFVWLKGQRVCCMFKRCLAERPLCVSMLCYFAIACVSVR